MQIEPLSQQHAEEIANQWHYDGIYAFYDMTADPEDYEEILSEQARKNHYYQVMRDGDLYGFFAINWLDRGRLELGLGMKPEHCGKGQGKAFLQAILDYLQQTVAVETIVLSVADFNQRAQQLYLNCGFEITGRLSKESNGAIYPFVDMQKKLRETKEKS